VTKVSGSVLQIRESRSKTVLQSVLLFPAIERDIKSGGLSEIRASTDQSDVRDHLSRVRSYRTFRLATIQSDDAQSPHEVLHPDQPFLVIMKIDQGALTPIRPEN